MGPPITYRFEGKQYVTVMGGVGLNVAAAGRGTGAPSAAPSVPPKLLTFALDGTMPLPTAVQP